MTARTVNLTGTDPRPYSLDGEYSVKVLLVGAIEAVQNAGYLVYEATEMPEITVVNGRPKLPARWGEVREDVDQRTAYYEEAFGKLALARWWEAEEIRTAKRTEELERTIMDFVFDDGPQYALLAQALVKAGWKR